MSAIGLPPEAAEPPYPAERPRDMRTPLRCALGTMLTMAARAAMVTACAATNTMTGSAAASRTAGPPTARERAVSEAAAILRTFVVPPGGQRLPKAPDVLKVPSSTLVSTTLVDDVSFWRTPGQPRAVLAWEQAHLPRRFTPEDAGFGPPSWDRTFSLSPVPGMLNAGIWWSRWPAPATGRPRSGWTPR